jgi:hypothetical protein
MVKGRKSKKKNIVYYLKCKFKEAQNLEQQSYLFK